jgi:hypothetical protein
MPFNNLGQGQSNLWLSHNPPDNLCNCSVWFDDPIDPDEGAQWIMATPDMTRNNPEGPGGDAYDGVATLMVNQFYKQATAVTGTGILEYYYVYQVEVNNVGTMDSYFWLDGGGNT